MKQLLITTIAAVLLVGCGNPEADRALLEAARDGNIEAVRQHLAAGADVNAKNDYGSTPLHRAAITEIAELLIAKGADVNAKMDNGLTPLHYAASNDHKEITELLIAAGADVNAKDDRSGTPLDSANSGTYAPLRKHGGKHGTIHGAAYGGDIEVVKEFLAAGTDVNAKTMHGGTPLRDARTKEIAELLIAKGADVNVKDKRGFTPLHYKARGGRNEIAELLISKGADVNAKNDEGKTALDEAKYNPDTAKLLRKHGGKTGAELEAEGK
jgi:ankyrin repeat protein